MKKQTGTDIHIRWSRPAELRRLLQDPETCRQLFGQTELLRDLLDHMRRQPRDRIWYQPAHLSIDGHWVAAGGFKGPPQKGTVEIGYRVHPDYRRRGYASALTRWLCQAALEHQLDYVVAVTATTNLASQGVLAHNGFVHTGDLLSDSQQWLQRWRYTVPKLWTGLPK
ncbi:GNAT family N-acetyltransferase [Saccharospirillum salsuginis]|uniref:N-acetyltransferase domain-containing protein n=1 Tax=Saccharospirillum salsuginis TaxID=418750 RepID=A0A918K2T8_9GAMM|nr:GNAT family N-acetyltransferase [Saccharospirillum salsuginis]GGX42034.1 hypothetical protein GCM10007392_06210 [Saccharospirillum salsuginis]